MQIKQIQAFQGANIYSHKPVIKMIIDIGELYKEPTYTFPNFNSTLIETFPGLTSHHCSLGYEGGFIDRLKEGTYIGHVTEHLILELQSILGHEVYYGKTRVLEEPSLYNVIYEYKNLIVGIECGKAAVSIINKLVNQQTPNIIEIFNTLQQIKTECEPGPSTKAILEEALRRGIPVQKIGTESLLQLGYGKNLRLMEASLSDFPSCVQVDVAGNKHVTKQLLDQLKLPVVDGDLAYTVEMAIQLADSIGYPVAVKPCNANQGKGVRLNIRNPAEVRSAFYEATKYSKEVIIEKYIQGRDFRILVVGDKVAAVAERRPPQVTGDGIRTIEELIMEENKNQLRGEDHEKPLTKIKTDSNTLQVLAKAGFDLNSIPLKGKKIFLRDNGNLSTGGTARECTRELHPLNGIMAVQAAKAVGLDIAGIDIITEDISIPFGDCGGAIIEVNAAPGLRMHLFPTEGDSINVAADILDLLFPPGKSPSIPIVSITGTNGKTTTTRLIRHTLTLMGIKVGMTSTSGIFIGEKCVLKGDNTGPISASMVLGNREVEAAVLETARGGLVKKGLGYTLADVGVITNISEDHLGMDGINSLEDLAHVKALVIEAVKPEGYAVLNCDDEMLDFFLRRVNCKVIVFSKNPQNPKLIDHMNQKGKAVYTRNNQVFIFDGKNKTLLLDISEIPITYGGKVECNIENALTAAAALYGLNVSLDIIRQGLKTFTSEFFSNPGRFNIFDMGDFTVLIDYGHNPAGYHAVVNFIKQLGAKRTIGVIGVPGDRLDKNIRQVGKICSQAFSKIYLKEDKDLRGRNAGEVSGILFSELIQNGMEKENIEVELCERKAVEKAVLDAQPGDLVVILYETFEPILELIQKLKKEISRPPHFLRMLAAEVIQGNIEGMQMEVDRE